MTDKLIIGFIGLGVMGEPMCRNLARKSGAGARVIALDLRPEPLQRLKADGVAAATSPGEIMERAEIVMLSLPSGRQSRQSVLARTDCSRIRALARS